MHASRIHEWTLCQLCCSWFVCPTSIYQSSRWRAKFYPPLLQCCHVILPSSLSLPACHKYTRTRIIQQIRIIVIDWYSFYIQKPAQVHHRESPSRAGQVQHADPFPVTSYHSVKTSWACRQVAGCTCRSPRSLLGHGPLGCLVPFANPLLFHSIAWILKDKNGDQNLTCRFGRFKMQAEGGTVTEEEWTHGS